jgi:hypothetical protein
VHRVLTSCRINRLWHVDRVTGEPDPPLSDEQTPRAGLRRHQEAG